MKIYDDMWKQIYMVKYDSEYCYAYDMKAFICKYMKGNNFMICNLGNIYVDEDSCSRKVRPRENLKYFFFIHSFCRQFVIFVSL